MAFRQLGQTAGGVGEGLVRKIIYSDLAQGVFGRENFGIHVWQGRGTTHHNRLTPFYQHFVTLSRGDRARIHAVLKHSEIASTRGVP